MTSQDVLKVHWNLVGEAICPVNYIRNYRASSTLFGGKQWAFLVFMMSSYYKVMNKNPGLVWNILYLLSWLWPWFPIQLFVLSCIIYLQIFGTEKSCIWENKEKFCMWKCYSSVSTSRHMNTIFKWLTCLHQNNLLYTCRYYVVYFIHKWLMEI